MSYKKYLRLRLKVGFLFMSAIILNAQFLLACTVIVGKDSSRVLVGFNEDFFFENPFIWFTNKTENHFRCAFFSYSYKHDFGWIKLRIPGKSAPQQGINEKGLFFDHLATPYHEIHKSQRMRSTSYKGIKRMMQTCATVEEAITYLKNHYFTHFSTAKILLADRTGKYTIYDGRDNYQNETADYCVTTNFLENDKGLGNYPCRRYFKANELFQLNGEITVENFNSILKSVKQCDENLLGGTFYSGIFNPQSGNLNLFYIQDFEQGYVLNIYNEMRQGSRKIYLKELFRKRPSEEIAKTLNRKGALVAMEQFRDLLQNNRYNHGESELIFCSKIFYNSQFYDEADTIIGTALERYPESQDVRLQSARTAIVTGDLNEYIDFYVEKGDIDPEFGRLVVTNDYEEALILAANAENKRALFKEENLNDIGYYYLRDRQVEVAIKLFKLNVASYPDAYNTYDSLGEAYMVQGSIPLAKENYTKSLELNPNNENAKKRLLKLNRL